MRVVFGEVDRLVQAGHEEWARIYVPHESWRRSREQLIAGASEECVTLAAHNAATRQGLLGHFSAVAGDWGRQLPASPWWRYLGMNGFASAIEQLPDLGPATETSIWLGGVSPDLDRLPETQFERGYALGRIAHLGLAGSRITVDWTQEPEHLIRTQLDCPSGTLTIQKLPPAE